MSKRTVKAGSSGRFGARYGVVIRNRVKNIERIQKMRHECPVCHHASVKRESSGIWLCRHCSAKFAASAYTPAAKKAISQVSE
ncbi:MAG: 50S ribosomal protein L37ae [Methanomassiliicoccaceae archaeon]|jgi:large subunit ribosomal protein L37Ae|nr:50S ribosomal protein L37ae [Methanomassiliicoccaceae archaeon]